MGLDTKLLAPYTVVDCTDDRGEIGPMLLGDLGADVIRVEPPGGSRARFAPPFLENCSKEDEDLRSLQFVAFNRNKRSIVIDPDISADSELLWELLGQADFVFESGRTIEETWGISAENIRQKNDAVVHVRLTPYGDSGPHSDYLATDLTIVAMGGPVSLQGPRERAPIRISVPQVWRHAGVEAAAGAMVALARLQRSGESQFVDLSAQCAMTWTMLNGMGAYAIQGHEFERTSSSLILPSGPLEMVHEASDGYLVAIANDSVLKGCAKGFVEDELVPDSYLDMDWGAYAEAMQDLDKAAHNFAEGTGICRKFFASRSKEELFDYGLKNSCTLAPINTLPELLGLNHLADRKFWDQLTLPGGQEVKVPGSWAKSSAFQLSNTRRAPKLNEHGDEIRRELLESTGKKRDLRAARDGHLPFHGVRVADFAWVGVGPISTKYLADHGADVVRVESEYRPDVLRVGVPQKGEAGGLNRSQFFGDFNTSKQSLVLDLKTSQGVDLAKRLIAQSDVFVESFAAGAISRMGLGYEKIAAINPGIIMVSTCLMGQTGPLAGLAGFGYHAAAIAGFYELTGWPDSAPSAPWIAYTDTIAPRFISTLIAAALDHKQRTGEGCYIDVAQIETALHFLAPELLDCQVNGLVASRMGNRSPHVAPEGVYPCQGEDAWCAISVADTETFHRLGDLIGCHHWRDDDALSSLSGRQSHHDELDRSISEWTSSLEKHEAMRLLQAAGVPAGAVQSSADLLKDRQYQHRAFYNHLEHPEMGRVPYAGHQYVIAGYNNGPRGPAPCIGEHSFEVLVNKIGLTDEEVANAYASGAIC